MKNLMQTFIDGCNVVVPKGAELEEVEIRMHFNKPSGFCVDVSIEFNKKEQCHIDMWLRSNAKYLTNIETVNLGVKTNPFNETHDYLKTKYTFVFKD